MVRTLTPWLFAFIFALPPGALARLSKGDPAPPFELENIAGGRIGSAGLGERGLVVLAFLGLESKPSRELALALDELQKQHGPQGLTVVAIYGDAPEKVREFASQQKLSYAVAADPARQTLSRYGADKVVPMTYILAPGPVVAEVIPGGGAGAQQVLLAIAEKEFARGNAATAGDLFRKASATEPNNAAARAGEAFALLKEGKLERAEEAFRAVSALGPQGAAIAAEGLAEVKLRQGDLEGAAQAVAKAPPSSGYADALRGEIAARRGDLPAAKQALEVASAKPFVFGWQKGVALNNLARISRETGDTDGALERYDRAIAAEPFLVEARSNKGATLEKAGRLEEAKRVLGTAKAMAPGDEVVVTLLRRIEEREKERLDLERQKLANRLVSELVEAWKSGRLPAPPKDEWAPRALVVSLIDLKNDLGPLSREGLAEAFALNLAARLQETGRIRVVERQIVDKLLAELKLGSSELADPTTQLRLGRVLAATVIGTGGFYAVGGATELQLRWIDTETTDIRLTLSETLSNPAQVASFAGAVAEKVAARLRADYPLRGKIASAEGAEIVVGLGRKHGAQAGLRLRVVEEGEPVTVDGEVIGHKEREVGLLELTRVEEAFAYAKPVSGGTFAPGQRVVEAAP
jgi:tetratricopeptide (TPR) repeat protein